MKSRFLSILCLALLCAPFASAQSKTGEIYYRIAKVDILCNVLPLMLTKTQLNTLLPGIEKCRTRVRKAYDEIDKVFLTISSLTEETYKKSVEGGVMPADAARTKFAAAIRAASFAKDQAIGENLEAMMPIFTKALTPAQRKIASNLVDIKSFEPNAKPDEMKQEDKERAYVRYVLLDQTTYDVLLDLAKAVKE